MKMTKSQFLLMIFLSFFSAVSLASEIETIGVTVKKIYTFENELVWLQLTEESRSRTVTCNHYGGDFKFYANNEAGELMLSTLLAARLSGGLVGLKYVPTTATAGSNQNSGCTRENMAELKVVYF